MSARNKLKEYIRQLIQKELAEASSTASAGNIHYKTPYAFKKNKKGKKKKKAGYGGGSYQPTIGTDNFLAKDPKLRNEGKYHEVPKQILRWNKVNGVPNEGLIKRRKSESLLFECKDWTLV